MAKKRAKKKSSKRKASKKKPSKKAAPKKSEGLLSRIKLPSFGLGKKAGNVSLKEVKSIEDEVRDLINWVAVFEQEYDLPREVADKLLRRLHSVARKVGWLRCK